MTSVLQIKRVARRPVNMPRPLPSQENYEDGANVDNTEQERRFQETQQRLQPWAEKTGARGGVERAAGRAAGREMARHVCATPWSALRLLAHDAASSSSLDAPRPRMPTVFLRNYTTEAAKQIPDGSLDYVYVDAR